MSRKLIARLPDTIPDCLPHLLQGSNDGKGTAPWSPSGDSNLNGDNISPIIVPGTHPEYEGTSPLNSSVSSTAPALVFSPLGSTNGTIGPSSATSRQRKFKCPISGCPRTFDRLNRAQACQNYHLGETPYACLGACGDQNWYG